MGPTLIHRLPTPTKKISGTTFYTLFAFGGACGAFLSAIAKIEVMYPFLAHFYRCIRLNPE